MPESAGLSIADNLRKIKEQILFFEKKYQRLSGSVSLLAVSKSQSLQKIEQAYQAGQIAFGENYLQEALIKIQQLKNNAIEWHFIGHVQSNKTKLIAEYFSWVEGIDSFRIAARLNEHRSERLPPLNICIQVNIGNEKTKSGLDFAEVHQLCEEVGQLKRLKLRGLMVIPPPTSNRDQQFENFQKIALLQKKLRALGYSLDTLSMGMSEDFEMAIAAGSTQVRIGSAIFGARG